MVFWDVKGSGTEEWKASENTLRSIDLEKDSQDEMRRVAGPYCNGTTPQRKSRGMQCMAQNMPELGQSCGLSPWLCRV